MKNVAEEAMTRLRDELLGKETDKGKVLMLLFNTNTDRDDEILLLMLMKEGKICYAKATKVVFIEGVVTQPVQVAKPELLWEVWWVDKEHGKDEPKLSTSFPSPVTYERGLKIINNYLASHKYYLKPVLNAR